MGLRPVHPDRVRQSIGLTLEGMLEFLTGEQRPTAQQSFRSLFLEEADRVMVSETTLFPGVLGTLEALSQSGLALSVVSTKYRTRIEAILDKYGAREWFDIILGGEDTTRHKPDPEGLCSTLQALGIPPADALYVGDHEVDAEAARRASVPFVGVLTGSTTEEEFRQFPHVGVVPSVAELPLFLDRGDPS